MKRDILTTHTHIKKQQKCTTSCSKAWYSYSLVTSLPKIYICLLRERQHRGSQPDLQKRASFNLGEVTETAQSYSLEGLRTKKRASLEFCEAGDAHMEKYTFHRAFKVIIITLNWAQKQSGRKRSYYNSGTIGSL